MNKKNVLVIGFQKHNQKMYPHTFDILSLLNKNFNVTYSDNDDRGNNLCKLGYYFHAIPTIIIHLIINQKIFSSWIDSRKCHQYFKKIFQKNYNSVLAIDHSALNYACKYKKKKTKLIFWSHDIITHDRDWYRNSIFIRKLISKNKKQVKNINQIIIQDHCRGAVLNNTINSHNIKKVYLPVSLYSNYSSNKVSKVKNNKTKFKKIHLIQVGSVGEDRYSEELINILPRLDTKIHLILLGHISKDVKSLTTQFKSRLKIFNMQSSFKKMRQIISTADIGIIGFRHADLNSHFYSKASGQLVEFLRLGIPVIALGSEELGEFIEKEECGLYIKKMTNLRSGIKTVIKNYSFFSKKSSQTFTNFFDLMKYENKIINIFS